MAYNTKSVLVDKDGQPAPQYFNPTADNYESLEGIGGAIKNILYGPDGSPLSVTSNKLAIRASELETALESILSKLSADPATQTTLAAILAKIITAPATEAKQNALNALVGEVQANPTENTLLARVKALGEGLSAIKDTDGIKKIADSLPAGGNKIGKVDVDSSALPTGAATSAKQDTLTGLIGEAQASPTANTLLARIKNLEGELANLNGKMDDILSGDESVHTQLTGFIPEYNWFAGEERPEPAEPTKPAIGVEVDAETGDITGLLWSGEDWEEA